jgi:hypothetical protein
MPDSHQATDYSAQHLNTAKTPTLANNTLKKDVELNVCTSSISRHLDWIMTAKPLLSAHTMNAAS